MLDNTAAPLIYIPQLIWLLDNMAAGISYYTFAYRACALQHPRLRRIAPHTFSRLQRLSQDKLRL